MRQGLNGILRENLFELRKEGLIKPADLAHLRFLAGGTAAGIVCADQDANTKGFFEEEVSVLHGPSPLGASLVLCPDYPEFNPCFAEYHTGQMLEIAVKKKANCLYPCLHVPCGKVDDHCLTMEQVVGSMVTVEKVLRGKIPSGLPIKALLHAQICEGGGVVRDTLWELA